MTEFDAKFLAEVVGKLRGLPPEATPRWGVMTGERMVRHLIGAMRYSLGELPVYPVSGSWMLRRVVRPLLLAGLVRLPRNVRFHDREGGLIPSPTAPGDAVTLREVSEAFLARRFRPEFRPPPHPALGELGARGWSRLHRQHIRHHLRQFGL